jgi:acyl dehydratase
VNVHATVTATVEVLKSRIGQEIGMSAWHRLNQERIDAFANVTEDRQFIHVDPERASAEAPFGGTIAHGFLTLSMLAVMGQEALPRIEGRAMGINYGFDRVRFLAPVPAGARVRGRFVLADVTMRSPREVLLRYDVSVEVENQSKPALVAEWLTMTVLAEARD